MKNKKEKDNLLGDAIKNFVELTTSFNKEVEEMFERKVEEWGNSAHVQIPRKHVGKDAKVFIKKHKKEDS